MKFVKKPVFEKERKYIEGEMGGGEEKTNKKTKEKERSVVGRTS